jgi:phage baseplate assembly protein W
MNETGKEFLGRGWAFPIRIESDRGRIAFVEYEEDVEQAIHIILSTSKGERVMRPDFGCGIHDLVFGAVSTSLITQIKESVTEALRKFEARIDLLHVDVDASKTEQGLLKIRVDYRHRTTNQPDNYVFPFYFKEAF